MAEKCKSVKNACELRTVSVCLFVLHLPVLSVYFKPILVGSYSIMSESYRHGLYSERQVIDGPVTSTSS